MKRNSSLMKMLCDKAPDDRQITKFPLPPVNGTPYEENSFSETTLKVCSDGRATLINNFKLSKVIVLGDLAVGKSSLVNRLCKKMFDSNYKATIGVDFEVERYDILDTPFNLQIWDTAGQERFKSIAQSYYRGAQAIVIVFDLTNSLSLMNTEKWLREALNASGNTDPFIFLVGTKRDLLSKHALKNIQHNGVRVAKKMNAEFWVVSSKTGKNINQVFSRIAALTFDKCLCGSIEKANGIKIGNGDVISCKSNRGKEEKCRQPRCGGRCNGN